jgi:hypothetical protein
MDKLSHMIADQVEANYWLPMRACRYGPQITHLLFIDDLLVFAEASIEQAYCVLHCLDTFLKLLVKRLIGIKHMCIFPKMLILNIARKFYNTQVLIR